LIQVTMKESKPIAHHEIGCFSTTTSEHCADTTIEPIQCPKVIE
jgi:hypothetical protein